MDRQSAVSITLLVLALGIGWASIKEAATETAVQKDQVKLSFAFMGCNRISHSDWKAHKKDNPSSANVPQFQQTFEDIAALKSPPSLFFFTGDLVVNLEKDSSVLEQQLEAWTKLYEKMTKHEKLTLVPLPGNHEMLYKEKEDKDADAPEVPNPDSRKVWLKWLKASKFDTYAKVANGPKPDQSKNDRLVDDQGELTYSFDLGDIHFVIVNTDTLSSVVNPATKHPYSSWVPYDWIEQDVKAAQANAKISAIFVLGHKPIVSHPMADEDSILNEGDYKLGDKLVALFQANSKVRAYLCAHEHLWECTAFPAAPKVYQVVAGNAGSPLNAKWMPAGGTYFGFSEIKVYESGKVGLINHKRSVPTLPQKYFEGPTKSAKPDAEKTLYPSS